MESSNEVSLRNSVPTKHKLLSRLKLNCSKMHKVKLETFNPLMKLKSSYTTTCQNICNNSKIPVLKPYETCMFSYVFQRFHLSSLSMFSNYTDSKISLRVKIRKDSIYQTF